MPAEPDELMEAALLLRDVRGKKRDRALQLAVKLEREAAYQRRAQEVIRRGYARAQEESAEYARRMEEL